MHTYATLRFCDALFLQLFSQRGAFYISRNLSRFPFFISALFSSGPVRFLPPILCPFRHPTNSVLYSQLCMWFRVSDKFCLCGCELWAASSEYTNNSIRNKDGMHQHYIFAAIVAIFDSVVDYCGSWRLSLCIQQSIRRRFVQDEFNKRNRKISERDNAEMYCKNYRQNVHFVSSYGKLSAEQQCVWIVFAKDTEIHRCKYNQGFQINLYFSLLDAYRSKRGWRASEYNWCKIKRMYICVVSSLFSCKNHCEEWKETDRKKENYKWKKEKQ